MADQGGIGDGLHPGPGQAAAASAAHRTRAAALRLDGLCADPDRRWQTFDRELRQGGLKHLAYDPQRQTLGVRRPKNPRNEDALQDAFHGKLAAQGIAEVFHFVNARCAFLSALTPLPPRYARRIADEDSLTATIIARTTAQRSPGDTVLRVKPVKGHPERR